MVNLELYKKFRSDFTNLYNKSIGKFLKYSIIKFVKFYKGETSYGT